MSKRKKSGIGAGNQATRAIRLQAERWQQEKEWRGKCGPITKRFIKPGEPVFPKSEVGVPKQKDGQ